MDLVARTPRLPAPGETITGRSFVTAPGGKGANQAVACARLGAPAMLVGQVGDDVFGQQLLAELVRSDVDTTNVAHVEANSGVAMIALDDEGQNTIIVVPGANGAVGERALERLALVLPDAGILLLQLEIPLDIVVKAAQLGQIHGATVVLDPAPACPLPPELYELVDVLTPNETEAATLTGRIIENKDDALHAAWELVGRGCQHVVIKMGGQGLVYAGSEGHGEMPAFSVPVSDTVAAGDAFNGAMAVALHENKSFTEALRWGAAGGALAVTKSGAQNAMPYRDELEALLASHI